MADGIVITVGDNVSTAPARKIREIGTNARDAHKYVELLKSELAKIGNANPVARLQTELARLQTAQQRLGEQAARTATAQERLATQTVRTATASIQAATAAERLAAANARTGAATAQAQAQVATATARASAAQAQGATAAQRLQAATTGAATAAQRLQAAQSASAAAASRAQAAQAQAALAAQRLAAAQNHAADATTRHTHGLTSFFRQLALVTLIIGATTAVGKLADAYTILQNRLGTVSTSQAQTNELTAETFRIAQTAGIGVQEIANSFTRFDRALEPLGKSQAETLRMTETITKALILGGATTTEAASAMLQLSQGFNAGKLQGDEFRSVAEIMPSMLNAIAQVMKKPISEIKELGSQGKITSQVMYDATLLMQKSTDEAFSKMDKTLAQATTMMKNSLIGLIGEFDNATGASGRIVSAFVGVSEWMDQVARSFESGESTVIGYMKGIGELMSLMMQFVGGVLSDIIGGIRTLTGETGETSNAMWLLELALKAIVTVFQAVMVVGSEVVFVLRTIYMEAKAAIEQIVALPGAILNWDFSKFKGINSALEADTAGALKTMREFQAKVMNVNVAPKFADPRVLGSVGSIREQTKNMGVTNLRGPGKNRVPPPKDDDAKKGGRKPRHTPAEEYDFILNKYNAEIKALGMLKPLREDYLEMEKIIQDLDKKGIVLTAAGKAELEGKIRTLREGKVVQQEFDRIYEEAVGPARTYNAVQKAAADLLQRGAISQEQYNRELYKAKEAYENAVDPLREMNIELEKQLKYSRMRPLQASIAQAQDQAREKNGGMLSDTQAAAIAANLSRLDQNNRLQAIENQLLEDSVGARQKVIDQLTVMKELAASGKEGFGAGDMAIAGNEFVKSFGIDTEALQIGVDAEMAILQQRQANIAMLLDAQVLKEADAQRAIAQIRMQQQQIALRGTEEFLGQLMTLQNSHSKKLAAIGKAAAIAQAMINTYKSATAAYAVGAQSGGPWLGAAYAAIAVAAGMANVAQIKAQGNGFMAGGYTGNIGRSEVAGVVHGQEYVTNAAATRRNRPILEAMNRGADFVNANSGGDGTTIINNYEFNMETSIHVEGKGEQSTAEALVEGADVISEIVVGKIVQKARNGEAPFRKLID